LVQIKPEVWFNLGVAAIINREKVGPQKSVSGKKKSIWNSQNLQNQLCPPDFMRKISRVNPSTNQTKSLVQTKPEAKPTLATVKPRPSTHLWIRISYS